MGYFSDTDNLVDIYCGHKTCERCRRRIKRQLFNGIMDVAFHNNIWRHFIVTVAGKEYRESHSITESFEDCVKAWNKLRYVIRYWYGDSFSYICFARAQKSGYCHLHILYDRFLDMRWIRRKAEKYPIFGWMRATNQNAVMYLTNDFFKDSEWHIPSNKRHYSMSRNIHFDFLHEESDRKMILIPKQSNKLLEMEIAYQSIKNHQSVVDLSSGPVFPTYGYSVPFDYYVKYFYKYCVK
jgi:hypothetical protein